MDGDGYMCNDDDDDDHDDGDDGDDGDGDDDDDDDDDDDHDHHDHHDYDYDRDEIQCMLVDWYASQRFSSQVCK